MSPRNFARDSILAEQIHQIKSFRNQSVCIRSKYSRIVKLSGNKKCVYGFEICEYLLKDYQYVIWVGI